MKFQALRGVIALGLLIELAALSGCGDPCLDDGQGKGVCNAADGGETGATMTDTADETADSTMTSADEVGTDDAGSMCSNDMQDGTETDVDCGGDCVDPNNPPEGQCDDGQMCELDSDCVNGNCEAGICGPVPDCVANGMQDGTETDVDCGGACVEDPNDPNNDAGKCDDGQMCELDSDCVNELCEAGVCGGGGLDCMNAMMDMGETDVDCGGVCVLDPEDPNNPAGKCDDGEMCQLDSDCVSNVCDPDTNTCAPNLCINEMMDMGETDVDCGGDCVADPNDPNNPEGKCDDDQSCMNDSDCVSDFCDPDTNTCAPNPCADMMQNNTETDVDCGGECVADPGDPNNPAGKCDDDQGCTVDSDCVSNFCDPDTNTCAPNPCVDGMQNNTETDVDCGGDCVLDPNDPLEPFGKCDIGQGCVENGDCISDVCDPDTNTCVDVCMNMVQDDAETDVDCGGACVEDPNDPQNPNGKCDDGQSCVENSDCVSNTCDPDLLVCVGVCENGVLDPDVETDIDCGDQCVEVNPNDPNDIGGQCNDGETCETQMDCVAGECTDNQCDVCADLPEYSTCASCLVNGCCAAVQACLADIPKCVCWFNCISQDGATVQSCMDSCGNGNIGMIQSCISNTCMGSCN